MIGLKRTPKNATSQSWLFPFFQCLGSTECGRMWHKVTLRPLTASLGPDTALLQSKAYNTLCQLKACGKRNEPIQSSAVDTSSFFLECKRHSQQLRSFNWHPNWHLTCAGKICHQRKVIWSHAAGYWLHTLQERMCLASCKESTNLLLKSKIFSSCLWHTFLWKEMQQDCAPCKASPCRDWVEATLKKQTGDQTCSFEALFWVAGFGQNHVGEVSITRKSL